jgi:uncharacterized protein (DUF1330 family)
MPAFVIVEIEIHNFSEYEQYKRLAPSSVAAYGGRYIVRGGETETLEGDWKPNRIVILEFPDMAHAKKWWGSDEYLPAKLIRQRAAQTKMILVEGFKN